MAEASLDDVEQALLSSFYSLHYRRELATSDASTLDRIEVALISGSSERFRWVVSLADGEPFDLMWPLCVRSDVFNGRALLRKYDGNNFSNMPPRWHDYGMLSSSFFHDLWVDCDRIVDVLERCYNVENPVVQALFEAFLILRQNGSVPRAERAYLSGLLDRCREVLDRSGQGARMVSEFLGRMVDLWNLHIWFRRDIDTSDCPVAYLDGGAWLSTKSLMEESSIEKLLRGTPWGDLQLVEGSLPPELGRLLQEKFVRWQLEQRTYDPLSIGMAIAYMARQMVEWRNLNILAVGLASGLEADKIRSLFFRGGKM